MMQFIEIYIGDTAHTRIENTLLKHWPGPPRMTFTMLVGPSSLAFKGASVSVCVVRPHHSCAIENRPRMVVSELVRSPIRSANEWLISARRKWSDRATDFRRNKLAYAILRVSLCRAEVDRCQLAKRERERERE